MDPPKRQAVSNALQALEELGAVEEVEAEQLEGPPLNGRAANRSQTRDRRDGGKRWVLTPIGTLLAQLPLDPHLGKMLVIGAVRGCVSGPWHYDHHSLVVVLSFPLLTAAGAWTLYSRLQRPRAAALPSCEPPLAVRDHGQLSKPSWGCMAGMRPLTTL
jgi:hypothetical protein